ncbi:hypothetical protein [Pseudomonas khavaziana]
MGVAAAAVVDGGADTKNLQVAAWAAQNATNYNSLNHEDAADFVADMNICGKDVTCQQKTWKAGKYDDISLGNYEEAMKTAGPAWAKSQITTLEGGLFALKSLNCQTDVCFNYKQTLEARAYENLDKLHTLVNTYEPYIAGIAGGVAGGVRPKQPTLREGETAGAQAGKSEAYWSKVNAETGGAKATGEVVPPAPIVTSGATRTGVVRTNAADWRALRDNWDDLGYGQILSTENRAAIAKGRTPKVDDTWVKVFPEDAGLKGERIPMHHVQGSPLTVPLPDTRHLDAHMPGGFRYNPGGPGSALPAYPPKKGAE